ncbi:outer-membrane lipoprotein carrier protein LolA [Sphingomonas sp.]|uniref:LolA family protein n=1 Tax=Sphingomonas sp. TaxID=28214 RepID=UPI0025D7414B|nr:outer-membrane lipoprotein carrier protein LolA [Sphingomonas sp.]
MAAPVAIVAGAVPAGAAQDSADLSHVRDHISTVQTMTADFVQTDAQGRSAAGTLQLKRPGHIRFQYGSGDLLLVGDGKRLWFLDYQVGQKNSWDINKTPLGMLLAANPDVRRIGHLVPNPDKRIVVVRTSGSGIIGTGTLVLAFLRSPSAPAGLQLYGWTAIDAQNKRTTVRLSNVRYNVPVPDGAFTFRMPVKAR